MKYDIAIIGGGPGGYTAAIFAGKKKASVALIEKDELGGTCLNRGCIPTKALIHSANLFMEIKEANRFGVIAKDVKIDWGIMQKNKQSIVNTLAKGVGSLLKANGVKLYRGNGRVINEETIKVAGPNGEETISADKIILATGSEPVLIPVPGHDLEGVITSDQALSLTAAPNSLLIIGGGVIGLELGYLYNSLGSEVTIVEMLPEILPNMDENIVTDLRRNLQEQGIKICTQAIVKEIKREDNILATVYQTREGLKTSYTQTVLMAAGRKPVTEAFQDLKLETTDRGVAVDDYLRTSKANIFAIGDVTGRTMLAHAASSQGIIAANNALGANEIMDYKAIPACIYTEPQVASVGLTETQARAIYGSNIKIGQFSFMANGKALTIGKRYGYIKIIAEAQYDEILGVHIIGPQATELISEAAFAIKLECTAEELSKTIHAHPTLSEVIMEAASDILGTAIHKLS